MDIKAIFSDIDGTLLNSQRQMTPSTKEAIQNVQKKNIKFVLVSGRCPSIIYSILHKNLLSCPIISYNGGLILSENQKLIYEKGMTYKTAIDIINYIQENHFELKWSLYSFERCFKPSTIHLLPKNSTVHYILCICNSKKTISINERLSQRFPDCTFVRSSKIALDIMPKGVNKATAISYLCSQWNIDLKDTMAFGDNYNDCEMLEKVGHGIVMGNAPEDIRNRFTEVTLSNNQDGISHTLKKYKIIE
ncbi:hypothetical protein M9Y10_033133 [Tritrichomonas musculus]|uniref:Haloacid dehalogenase-like hydrolase family protein n=1 Tax=Tritrichomonas musculus TaxID=1915356 RepID=A0ABR2GZ34_9EUKA